MTTFELFEPKTLDEATALLAQHGDEARIIAGGTAVVIMLKNRLIAPRARRQYVPAAQLALSAAATKENEAIHYLRELSSFAIPTANVSFRSTCLLQHPCMHTRTFAYCSFTTGRPDWLCS